MLPLRALIFNRIQLAKVYPILSSHAQRRLKGGSRNELSPSAGKGAELDTEVKPLGQKVKETTKTASYLAIILGGVGICGVLVYALFNELFSSSSPNNIYSKAAKRCVEHAQVSDKLGYPISAYGEETRRGRRRHVSHAFYLDREGRKHIRMKFYLKGTAHSGTANLDMVEGASGGYEYRYLFVEVDDMLRNVIVVEDNRNKLNAGAGSELLNY